MHRNSLVHVQVDETVKNEATAVLTAMGLSVSDVIRKALTIIAEEKKIPFEMYIPNKLTAETMEKSERGEDVYHAKDATDLFKQLGI